jgi:hypothetical protein
MSTEQQEVRHEHRETGYEGKFYNADQKRWRNTERRKQRVAMLEGPAVSSCHPNDSDLSVLP